MVFKKQVEVKKESPKFKLKEELIPNVTEELIPSIILRDILNKVINKLNSI